MFVNANFRLGGKLFCIFQSRLSQDLENCFSGSENGILAESSRICRYMQVALVVGFYRFPPGKGQGALGTSGVSFMTSF